MTNFNVTLSEESVVTLAMAANDAEQTLNQYINNTLEQHARAVRAMHTEIKQTDNKDADLVDIDEQKKQMKATSPNTEQVNNKQTTTDNPKKSQGAPLYNKRETNTWKIW